MMNYRSKEWYLGRDCLSHLISPADACYSGDAQLIHNCLIELSLRPCPKDWIFWENKPADDFARDFGLMLGRKGEVIPGTWMEWCTSITAILVSDLV